MCYDSPRVRILMDYRPALRQRTGAGEYVHRLATALQARLSAPDTLTLFSSSWKDRLAPGVVPGARRVDARVPVSVLNLAWHRLEWPPVEWLSGPVDVAQSMHPLLLPARSAAQFVTIHDLYFLERPDQTTAEIRRDYGALAASHARRADGVIVPSEYTRALLEARFGVPSERMTVCSPGRPDWTPREDGGAPGPILFVGTIEPRKNVGGLLRAYAALVRTDLNTPDLVLAGRAASVIDTDGMVDGVPLRGRVQRPGYVDEARRLALYHSASMLVLPSFDEGFGLPVLEAMTLGVPVVAARRGSLPEVLGGAGLLVEPDDHEGMAGAMRTVLSNPAERRRMRDAGLSRARTYSWDVAAARLYEAYAAALARRKPARRKTAWRRPA
ncbi:MAG: glycosyltransferase family 4 protein [Acidobacteriota bacterium]|nr:glycosyltransferase family 4 protein [Acidobacteriota bacterium]